MKGDPGPYVDPYGPDVWVPRTVPYREAWGVARSAVQESDQHVAYRGKVDATLLGFARDCPCEEECERRWVWDDEHPDGADSGDRECEVPAWHFEIVENAR